MGGPFSTNPRRMHRARSSGGAGAEHAETMLEAEAAAKQATAVNPADRRREKRREFWRRVRFAIYCHVYARWVYRPHMRAIHYFGRHWYSIVPMDGSRWCHWCGDRRP